MCLVLEALSRVMIKIIPFRIAGEETERDRERERERERGSANCLAE